MTFNVLNLLNIVRDHMNRQFELNFMEFYPACFILQSWDAKVLTCHYNMTVWILARNDIIFSMAAGLIRLHMPGFK